ncbi:MAG: DUF86 domain-containing protein [Cyclobacteriaceae bacterium]
MADDVVINKTATIKRCLERIKEDYDAEFRQNYTKQDAIILNIERACQACIDIAAHIVKTKKLGVPQDSRETCTLLQQKGVIDEKLSQKLQAMVSFRNISVHDYTSLNLDIVVAIVEEHLHDFTDFTYLMLQRF